MRLVSFLGHDGPRLGVQVDRGVVDLRAAAAARAASQGEELSDPLLRALIPGEMEAFIEGGSRCLDTARAAVQFALERGGEAQGQALTLPAGRARLLAPLRRPPKVVCIGLNYSDHAAESGAKVPEEPVFFTKFASSIVGPDEPVVHPGPELTEKLDYEVELAVVVGRRGRDIAADRAMDYVYGYTVLNDISARDLQFRDGQWVKGKALDSFAPLGPCVVTADEVADPHRLGLRLRLNGQTMQNSSTSNLIFGVPTLIAFLSRLFTLEPGDIISTGTPPGVGFARKPPVYLKPGDVMEAEVEGIGALRNPVVGRRERP